jgi:hypothetical protein
MARPSFFTIEEAARVLRIGRTAAYQAAKQYRDTGGAGGLKVIQVGGTLRVPGAWLDEMAEGPVEVDNAAPPVALPEERRPQNAPKPPSRRRPSPAQRISARDAEQSPLPFSD